MNDISAVFDAASVALNDTVVVPIGNVAPRARPAVRTNVIPGQLSFAGTAAYVTTAPAARVAATVMFGNAVTFGACVSRTVTVKVVVASGLTPLDAVAVTVVAPTGNEPGNVGANDTVGTGFPVIVTAGRDTLAEQRSTVLSTTMLVMGAIVGASAVIVTLKLASDEMFDASTARYVTVVVPIGNTDPDGNPATGVIVGAPQLSDARGTR